MVRVYTEAHRDFKRMVPLWSLQRGKRESTATAARASDRTDPSTRRLLCRIIHRTARKSGTNQRIFVFCILLSPVFIFLPILSSHRSSMDPMLHKIQAPLSTPTHMPDPIFLAEMGHHPLQSSASAASASATEVYEDPTVHDVEGPFKPTRTHAHTHTQPQSMRARERARE